ncbi:MAG: dipeptide epimerase [Candidatus Omnitrophica bacterium]|jgi:L-alanine-DL-glutamate epimerase-like enolase superfamily enzyme|nr:dipeptide epimerase [Candidatus Omnitrophota bacterium]
MSDKSLRISSFSVSILKKGLICPFRTSLGEHKNLENILFTLKLENGIEGYGEAGIATHITGETIEETSKNLKVAGNSLIGKSICDYLFISAELNNSLPRNKSAVAAIEMALLDALTKKMKIPLWNFFGNSAKKLSTDITIVISDLAETEKSIKNFYQKGFRAFKVKIGKNMGLDFRRVCIVKKIAKNSRIYLDANQGYNAKETLYFLNLLKKVNIIPDLIEQPVKKDDWQGLGKVTRDSKVPVCADESVSTVNDCIKAIKEKAVSAVNIKLMKSGLIQAREIARLAHQAGLNLMIGGMLESSLAMTASAHFAAGLGCFKYVDLDTPFFLKEGVKNPYLNSRGIYDLTKVKAGIGINPK